MTNESMLQAHLDFTQANVPYYRERVSAGSRLEDFPLMTRQRMLENYADLLSDAKLRAGELPDILRGNLLRGGERNAGELTIAGGLVVEQTSGTSGVPARFVKTRAERYALSLSIWKHRRKLDSSVAPGNFVPLFHLPPGVQLSVNPFDPSEAGVKLFYEWLASREGRWLHMPPALLERHLAGLKRIGLKNPAPKLRFIETSGAPLRPEALAAAAEVLDVTLVNQYGTREVWAIGYAAGGSTFEILDDAVVVELIDEAGRTITSDLREGSVLVTSKILRLLPIVRYVTGDRGRWTTTPAGRRLELVGDRDATLLFYQGRWMSGTQLFKTALGNVYNRIGYVKIDYLQIRKVGEKNFSVDIAGDDSDVVFHALVEQCRSAAPEAQFVQNRIVDATALLNNPDRKPYIFVNQYDKIDRSGAPSKNPPSAS